MWIHHPGPGGNYRERYVLITERRGKGFGVAGLCIAGSEAPAGDQLRFQGCALESARERLQVLVEQKLRRLLR